MIFTTWCVVGLIHLGLTIYLAIAYTKVIPSTGSHKPSLSVIIAARNEELNLTKLVPLLLAQNYEDFEVIVALDRCTDGSKSYLEELASSRLTIVEIKQLQDDWNTKKYALKTAISKAKGEWLVFTDADCEPSSDQWLSTIAKHVADQTDIIIGISPYQSKGAFLSNFIQYEAFVTAYTYIARALKGKPYMAVGRNMAIRRSFYEASPGYEPIKSIQGGDDDLFIQSNATKENTKVMLGRESVVHTFPKTTWKAYWTQKVRHLSVGTKYKLSDQIFLGINHFSHLLFVFFGFFAAIQGFFLPVLLFYLFIKLVSYRFASSKMGININYILLPLVDIIYAMLIPAIALWSKLEKDIKWKN